MNTSTEQNSNKIKIVPKAIIVGDLWETNSYGSLTIINNINSRNIVVKFVGYSDLITVSSHNLRKGKIRNAALPNIQNLGFSGIGEYSKTKDPKAYQSWVNIFERCYSPYTLNKRRTYLECTVCKEWHNFQNFAKWFYLSNYQDKWHLDKDIINQGNKIYSPENCAFVDVGTNSAVTDSGTNRGEYMLGVSLNGKKKFRGRYNDGNGNQVFIGNFNTELEAHNAYKVEKYSVLLGLVERQTDDRVKKGLLSWIIPKY